MAQPVNTFDQYDMVGIYEDLESKIYDISPTETPFLTRCGKTTATNYLHEWQTDALRAAADNAHVPGDDTVATARTPTVRLGNYVQQFKDAVTVSGGDKGLSKAGRDQEMVYQTGKVMKEQKLDIEKALFANQARVSGSSLLPPRLAGLPAWLTTNTVFESGSSGADPTGDGTNSRTDDGTPVAFSQTRLNNALRLAWDSGGKPDVVMLSSFQMGVALGFDGNNGQTSTIAADRATVVNDIAVYRTAYGTVDFVMCRHNRPRDVFVLQMDMWKVANKRAMKSEELAKTGDSDKRQVITELTLVSCNEKASGAVYDNTVS